MVTCRSSVAELAGAQAEGEGVLLLKSGAFNTEKLYTLLRVLTLGDARSYFLG